MALAPGTKLGPYEILSPLGAGGMGEVYRARDTRLDRIVAIKILPSHLSDSDEARSRFEREARSISSLNHPNICTLHDIGTQDGTTYLVMEYVEGETLDARLQKGPLPLKQALECAMQICDALEKAHRAGIVHRDLKPGNIMLTGSGAKLLDFGLAKPSGLLGVQMLREKANLTPSTPTLNLSKLAAPPAALTQQGTIVGTFQYLGPEILQGEEATSRSDLFSFGCVLYEMVTGKRAFEGKTQLSVMTAILEKDPEPLTTVQPTSPPALAYTIQTCLEKSPDNRFQTAHDVKLQLAWIAKSDSQAPTVSVPKKRNIAWLTVTAVSVVAVLVLAALLFWTSRTPVRVLRTNLLPPEGTVFETLYRNGAPALSPDGTHVAFIAKKDGKNVLWLRFLDHLESTPVESTDEAFFPFWSPNSAAIAFFMRGKLWRTDLNGGSPAAICDAPEGRGGSWGRGDVIIFAPSFGGPVFQVPASGGTPRPVTRVPVAAAYLSDRWPSFLPDGKHFLYLHSPFGTSGDNNEIHLASLNGTDKLLLRGKFYAAQYVAGRLLAVRDGSLFAWNFDVSSAQVTGDPVRIVDKVETDEITALSVFSISNQGTLLYQVSAGPSGNDRHILMDTTGKELAQVSDPSVYGPTRISPDGSRIAMAIIGQSGISPLWVWDLTGGTRTQLSVANEFADAPVWSADGRTIYFDIFGAEFRDELHVVPADGSQAERTLIKSDRDLLPVDVTSDGKWLLYEEAIVTPKDSPQPIASSASVEATLKALPLTPEAKASTIIEHVANGSNARLKPVTNDWIAYQSNQSGSSQVYLTRFPHPGAKYQISRDGGAQPVWSKDGKMLYYLDPYQKLTAIDINVAGDGVRMGTPRTFFPTGIRHSIPTDGYDVTRDGRFLVLDSVTASKAPVVLVTNWDAELKK